MKYTVFRTDQFNDQLNDIITYIARDASVDTALEVLDRLEESISRLGDFPESGSIPRYTILRRQGYRVLIVMRWLIFYKYQPEQEIVMLYAIADQRQEYLQLL